MTRAVTLARGFTIVEVLIALVLLTIGMLALLTTAGHMTRALGRGHRATLAAILTQRVIEEQRLLGCARRVDGARRLHHGGAAFGTAGWTWSDGGPGAFRLRVTTTYLAGPGPVRRDVTETTISCP